MQVTDQIPSGPKIFNVLATYSLMVLLGAIIYHGLIVWRRRRRINIFGSDQNILLREMVIAPPVQLSDDGDAPYENEVF